VLNPEENLGFIECLSPMESTNLDNCSTRVIAGVLHLLRTMICHLKVIDKRSLKTVTGKHIYLLRGP
jgi:hypothetical protein